MAAVLIIDDNEAVRRALELLYSLHDIDTVSAASPAEGLAVLDARDVDLVVQDMNFTADTTSGEEGIALFRALRERDPDLPIILLTAWTHLETAVQLVKAGAADYLAKPWDDHKLLTAIKNLLELRASLRAQQRHGGEPARGPRATRAAVRAVRRHLRERRHARAPHGRDAHRARRRAGAHHGAERRRARRSWPRSSRRTRRCAAAPS